VVTTPGQHHVMTGHTVTVAPVTRGG